MITRCSESWTHLARLGPRLLAASLLLAPLAARADGNPAAGRAVYEQSCAACHGPNGRGDGPAAMALNPKPRNFTDAARMAKIPQSERLEVVTEGGASAGLSPVMPAFKGALSPQQIDDVLAYVATFAPKAAPAVAQH